MPLSETIARQARSPAGPLGRIVAWFMARETAQENEVAVGFLAPPADGRILEVGCGHGRTLRLLARLHERRLNGRHLAWMVAMPAETLLPTRGAGAVVPR